MNAYQLALVLVANIVAGIFFAYYLKIYPSLKKNSWKNHLWQWGPIGLGAVSIWLAGYWMQEDTFWSWYGVLGSVAGSPGLGYVFGTKIFKNVIYFVSPEEIAKKEKKAKLKALKAEEKKGKTTEIDGIPVHQSPVVVRDMFPELQTINQTPKFMDS